MARPAYRIAFTVDNLPFHVRRDRVIAVGTRPTQMVQQEPDGPVMAVNSTTMITVDGIGNIPVGESLDEALSVWDDLVAVDRA